VFGLVLRCASVSTVDLTLKFQANKHPPLTTSPHPVGPFASSANSSTGQKLCTCTIRENRNYFGAGTLYTRVQWKRLVDGFYKISSVGRTCFVTFKFVVLNIEHGADQFGLYLALVTTWGRFRAAYRRTLRRKNQEGNTELGINNEQINSEISGSHIRAPRDARHRVCYDVSPGKWICCEWW